MSTDLQKFSSSRIVSGASPVVAGSTLFGALLGLAAPLVVSWNLFFDTDFAAIGLQFLAVNVGYAAATLALRLRVGRVAVSMSSVVAAVALLSLALAAPPAPMRFRLGALALLGVSASLCVKTVLRNLPIHASVPLRFRSGVLVTLGCMASTAVGCGAYLLDRPSWAPAALSLLPVGLSVRSWIAPPKQELIQQRIPQHRRLAVIALSLLLFFQSSAEWLIAGWLPLYLMDKLGASPAVALGSLLLLFAMVALSRLISVGLVAVLRRSRILSVAGLITLAGFLLFGLSGSVVFADLSLMLIGLGCGPIFPVTFATLDERFPFDVRFYERMSLIAVTGAFGSCWLFGYVAHWFGIEMLPLVGAGISFFVLVFSFGLILERRLMGSGGVARQA